MKRTLTILALLSALTAQARLGEAITACDQRYNAGKPGQASAADKLQPLVSGPNTTNITYLHQSFSIRVGFRDSVATAMEYTKIGSARITPAELEAIFEANGGDWTRISAYSMYRSWKGMDEIERRAGGGPVWVRQSDYSAGCLYKLERSLFLKREALARPGAHAQPPPSRPATPDRATRF